MTTDETELRGLKMLIHQTEQRAKAYRGRISDPKAKETVDMTVTGLFDLAVGIDMRIEELKK